MLRILENLDTTLVTMALLELIKEFQEKDDENLVGLGVKCLLKISDKLSENINNIQIEKIFLPIHLLLLIQEKKNPVMKIKEQNISKVIINAVSIVVRVLVKLRKEKILEDYSKFAKNQSNDDKLLLNLLKEELAKI